MNQRRKLLAALGLCALTAPLGAFAQQQSKVWRVGFLAMSSRPASVESDFLGAFPQGMRDLGYVEGKNLMIEWRSADGKTERLPALAADLVKLNVDVIVTAGTQATDAARKATSTIPIVMGTVGDPVASGFVKSLARPGGNITGLSNIVIDISPKHLEMLRTFVPKLSRLAVLVNSANSSHSSILGSIRAAAQRLGVAILPIEARTPQDFEKAFSTMSKENASAVIVAADAFFTQQIHQIAELASKHRLPSIYTLREFSKAGGLMSYGQNIADNYRRAATYVDKILKGAKPGDLPIEQPTRIHLAINSKTAKALGLTIPQELLIRADEVIE